MNAMFSRLATERESRIITLALGSRIAVLTLMILSDAAFPDLATSARLQNFPCDGTREALESSPALRSTPLDELAPWDTVYFVRIAKCGYENDMVNAFFPLLPLLMRIGAKVSGKITYIRYKKCNALIDRHGLD